MDRNRLDEFDTSELKVLHESLVKARLYLVDRDGPAIDVCGVAHRLLVEFELELTHRQ